MPNWRKIHTYVNSNMRRLNNFRKPERNFKTILHDTHPNSNIAAYDIVLIIII